MKLKIIIPCLLMLGFQVSYADMRESCELDIDLANFADAILNEREAPEGIFDEEKAEEIKKFLEENSTNKEGQKLQNPDVFIKLIEACTKGEILQGWYE